MRNETQRGIAYGQSDIFVFIMYFLYLWMDFDKRQLKMIVRMYPIKKFQLNYKLR